MRLRDWLRAGFWFAAFVLATITAPLRAPERQGSIHVAPAPPPITQDDRDWLAIATCLEVVVIVAVLGALIVWWR